MFTLDAWEFIQYTSVDAIIRIQSNNTARTICHCWSLEPKSACSYKKKKTKATFSKRTWCLCGVGTMPFIIHSFQGHYAIVLFGCSSLNVDPHWKTGETEQSCNLPSLSPHLTTLNVSFRSKHSPSTQTSGEHCSGNKCIVGDRVGK